MASLVSKKKPYKSPNINYEVLQMSQCKEKNDNEYQIASKAESGFIKKRTFNDTRQLVVLSLFKGDNNGQLTLHKSFSDILMASRARFNYD